MKIKKIVSSLLAGAFGAILLAPASYAWERPVVAQRAKIWEDRQDMRRDMAEGRYGAAAHEQAEINARQAAIHGYYNGGYYYPRSYTYSPYVVAPGYAYGSRHHHHRHWNRWHHDDD